ncbi:MAG: hypothetical protein M1467_03205 [Deltaproteobacteria bacterium]|jgi:hypothetical protein|nr:hypothetical protein [Deltaproteobacteria bacterium]
MFKKFKKVTTFIVITTLSMYLTLSLANTRNAFAFIVPSLSGVINAASSLADAGQALQAAGAATGITLSSIPGPFGLSSQVNILGNTIANKFGGAGKIMVSMAKLQVSLAKVQSSVNAATNAVSDVYNAEGDITGAQNSLLSSGIVMTNCQGGSGIMGSIASENCTENTINANISGLSGVYSDYGVQAGVSGAGISGVLSGSSPNQAALLNGVNNFQNVSENGLGGSVSISPTSNLCQDEIASGMVSNSSQCTENYSEAVNSELNKNMLGNGTEGMAQGNAEIAAGSGFSNAVSSVNGSYDLQQVELLKMLAEENAQQLKATGVLTKQIAMANQAKAAKAINDKKTPVVGKPNDPIKEMISNGWYY